MAINGVQWKGSIFDTYNDNKKFGGEYVGFDNAKAAGGATPVTTDFIKGITPQEKPIKFTGDATKGFSANLAPSDKNKSEFNMVDDGKATKSDFDALNTNTLFNSTKRYQKPKNP